MNKTVPEPYVSPDFTIDDIHRIREYHYELTKDMTTEERCKFYNDGAKDFLKRMEERKLVMKEIKRRHDNG